MTNLAMNGKRIVRARNADFTLHEYRDGAFVLVREKDGSSLFFQGDDAIGVDQNMLDFDRHAEASDDEEGTFAALFGLFCFSFDECFDLVTPSN